MKDKTNLLIAILFGGLVILTVYRVRLITTVLPLNESTQTTAEWQIDTEFEVYGNGAIGVYPSLTPLKKCVRIDTFDITLREVGGGYLESIQENDSTNTDFKRICHDKPVSFGEIFNSPDNEIDSLVATYHWSDSTGNRPDVAINLLKRTSISLADPEKSTDVVILLYPILWMAIGVLILAKLTKLIKD